jgi:FtsZ-binding cell division protein ZapB
MRKPSVETQLRGAKSQIAILQKEVRALTAQRDQYRVRATKAEQETAEWKARFDILLKREESK